MTGSARTERFVVDDDHFHDECGLFGIFGHPEAARLTYLGLYALQHRGQESTGIVASDGERLRVEKGMGLVNDFFTDAKLEALPGDRAMGHNRPALRLGAASDTTALSEAQQNAQICSRAPSEVKQ